MLSVNTIYNASHLLALKSAKGYYNHLMTAVKKPKQTRYSCLAVPKLTETQFKALVHGDATAQLKLKLFSAVDDSDCTEDLIVVFLQRFINSRGETRCCYGKY